MFRQRLVFALCLFFVLLSGTCQKQSREKIPPFESSERVILAFDVYNHTQGFLTKFERQARSGDPVKINIKELQVEGVDEDRVVIREGRLGARVAVSQSGSVTFEAPSHNNKYTVYLLNASSGADYRKVDTWQNRNEGILEYSTPLRWFREDRNGLQGPEEVIRDAIDQLNQALSHSWADYGSFQKIDQRKNSSFGVGYGYCRNQFGWHNPYWAGVNPDHCTTYKTRLETFLEEIFELITRLNDIGGKDTASLITDADTGNLNEMGKDLLAYVFVKDDKI